MSFHFVSHSWEVQDIQNGTLVILRQRDLDSVNVHDMVDELSEIARENGKPNLHLDFARVSYITSEIIGILIALDARLRECGGRLILTNVDPLLRETLRAGNAAEIFEIQSNEFQVV